MDPERTAAMKKEEGQVIVDLNAIRARMCFLYERDGYEHPSVWIEPYLKDVQGSLDVELMWIRRWMLANVSIKGSPGWKEKVHARRRIIAIYHQEINLLQQGAEVPWMALERDECLMVGLW